MDKTLFEYNSYKEFVLDWVSAQAKGGRGEFSRISKHLGLHQVVISQTFRGERHLTDEAAFKLCTYLRFSQTEIDFFMALLRFEKAGEYHLKRYYKDKLEELRKKAAKVSGRIGSHQALGDEEKAQYYSQWIYSAIRLGVDLEGVSSLEDLIEHLKLSPTIVADALEFLLESGLVEKDKKGNLETGPTLIHVDKKSPLVVSHHRNWRLKALEKYAETTDEDLFFTLPMTLSREDALRFREMLLDVISKITGQLEPSPPEQLSCLGIDFFKVLAPSE